MEFPQYRRYRNGKSYFEILNADEFVEYQLQFGKVEKHHFIAKILPDRNYIQDMLDCHDLHWDKIDKLNLEEFLAKNSQ